MTRFYCQYCQKEFYSLEKAVGHTNSHEKHQRSCVVPECRNRPRRLSRHLRRWHQNLCNFRCGLCEAVFVRDHDLKMHQKNRSCPNKKGKKRRKKNKATAKCTDFVDKMCKDLGFDGQYKKYTVKKTVEAETVDFRRPVKASDLNRFIRDNLQPTTAFNEEMKRTVEQICSFLREHMSPNKIVKGGSLGKGTAIKEKSDIDLVLVLNEVKDAADLKDKLPGIKEEIIQKLSGNTRKSFTMEPDSLSETKFAVQFSVLGSHGSIDVDLLPSFNFEDLHMLYEKMKGDQEHLEFYSASLVEKQVNFVSEYLPDVKNLIRLVKYWKKEMLPSTTGRRIPTSYVMELITIHIWERQRSINGESNTLKMFHSVLEALNYNDRLNAVWEKYYTKTRVPQEIKYERPLVVDPANPMNNVCKKFEWREIENAAKEVLDSPMMSGVTSYDG